jgi:hypothetical protein
MLALHTHASAETLLSRRVMPKGEPRASAHDEHATVPCTECTLKLLSGQGAHSAAPVVFLKLPAAHARHVSPAP